MRSYDVEMVPTDNGPWCLKSEVDAYIRHHKYKRCLAMAKWCAAQRDIFGLTPRFARVKFYKKWRERWLNIAEQFKEAK